jgi:hypothetical protein
MARLSLSRNVQDQGQTVVSSHHGQGVGAVSLKRPNTTPVLLVREPTMMREGIRTERMGGTGGPRGGGRPSSAPSFFSPYCICKLLQLKIGSV